MESSVQFICVFCRSLSDEYGCPCSTYLQTLGNTSNQLKQEEQDSSQYWKPPFYYSDDDDDFYRESIDETPPSDEITPDLPITDSLVMEDEHLDTIPETDSDEEIESSVKNLNLTLSESEDLSDYVSECDLPIFDDSPLDVFKDNYVLFPKPRFDSYGDSTSSKYSSDNESFLAEDVFSNLLFEFDIESISSDVNSIYDEVLEDIDCTNYLINSIIDFSPKIDPLLEEFAGELALINPIPPGIAGADFNPEGDIRLIEKLSYDNSSPYPSKKLNSEDIIEFFSIFPIPVEDSDFFLEKTETFLSLPELDTFSFDIEEKNSGSNTTHADISLPKYDSFHFDLSDTSLQLPDKSDSVPFENRNKTFDPGISIEVRSKRFLSLNEFSILFISDPLSPVHETLLPFSSENEDKVFNPGILASKEEKSPHILSHRGFKAFKNIYNFLNESPMMIYEGDISIWDVLYLHFDPP
ncbi:hypothetical protein Tco_1273319 [Tanacetum coccineum]